MDQFHRIDPAISRKLALWCGPAKSDARIIVLTLRISARILGRLKLIFIGPIPGALRESSQHVCHLASRLLTLGNSACSMR
jgi:hypothetical protein